MKMLTKLREGLYQRLADYHFRRYMKWRDKLLAQRIESGAIDVNPQALQKEFKKMTDDLDREQPAQVVSEEVRIWN